MPNTPRMSFPYPTEGEDPHFDKMVSFFNSVDASGYAAREDRNIVLHKGGDLAFDSVSGVLSWATNIEIYAPVTGFLWVLTAGQVTLDDGEAFYVDLTRAPTTNTTVAAAVTSQIPSSNNALVLGLRRGTKVYFRNGTLIESGTPVSDIGGGGGGGGGGSVTHASTTGKTANDHHDELHTVASHSDTTATGPELETLTDGSNADALHTHAVPSGVVLEADYNANTILAALADNTPLPISMANQTLFGRKGATGQFGDQDQGYIDNLLRGLNSSFASSTTLTGTQDNLFLPDGDSAAAAWLYEFKNATTLTVTGFLTTPGNQTNQTYFKWCVATGAGDVVFKHQDVGSTSDHRFILPGGNDLTLKPGQSCLFFYIEHTGQQRWICLSDVAAIHGSVPSEISALTEKATPVGADHLMIEDSADSNNKKRVQITNLPAGSVTIQDAYDGGPAVAVTGNTPIAVTRTAGGGQIVTFSTAGVVGGGELVTMSIDATQSAGTALYIRDHVDASSGSNNTVPFRVRTQGGSLDKDAIRVANASPGGGGGVRVSLDSETELRLMSDEAVRMGREAASGGAYTVPLMAIGEELTFPNADGSNGDVMTTDGAGTISWQAAASGFDVDTILTAPDEVGEILIDVDGNVLVSL